MQAAIHLRRILGQDNHAPLEMDGPFMDQAALFLGAIADPQFSAQLNESKLLSGEFATPVLREHLSNTLAGLARDEDPIEPFSPRSPPKKRSRSSLVASDIEDIPSSFPLVPATFPAGPVASTSRGTRSASRGSGRLSNSGSQTDLKRKRTARK